MLGRRLVNQSAARTSGQSVAAVSSDRDNPNPVNSPNPDFVSVLQQTSSFTNLASPGHALPKKKLNHSAPDGLRTHFYIGLVHMVYNYAIFRRPGSSIVARPSAPGVAVEHMVEMAPNARGIKHGWEASPW